MTDTVFDGELFSSPEEQRAYEEFCAEQERVEEFSLDNPALICRWRMAKRQVPLLNRHIRALSQRTVNGAPLLRNMLSWAKQHVEWSLAEGDYEDPNGVLMLVVDINGNAAMTVGSYEPLADTSIAGLRARAAEARAEQAETGVAPELLCVVRDGVLQVGAGTDEPLCGAGTLVEQLATTKGHRVVRAGGELVDDAAACATGAALLVSDEHGVVPASELDERAGADADAARFLAQGVAKLFV